MKTLIITALFSLAALGVRAEAGFADDAAAFEDEVIDLDRWTTSASAKMVLPQGGADLRRLGGGAVRVGYYLNERWAVESEVSWLEDRVGLAVNGLWHWWGYERFDPFFTFGARGWLHDGDVGPMGGTGFFFHLSEDFSLRFDADATLGLERKREIDFTLGAGLQYYW